LPVVSCQAGLTHRLRLATRKGFTLIEMLTTVAVLIIVLGLMVSLAAHVRRTSAAELTKDLLLKLDEMMLQYAARHSGELPKVVELLDSDTPVPASAPGDGAEIEQKLAGVARSNNGAFVQALKNQQNLGASLREMPISIYDEVQIRDAWGSPIVLMPRMHPSIGMASRHFFFSAGPDKRFLTRDDNLYSYEGQSR
jgi:type II secretory pathway pseudopilin PulG